MLRVPEKTNFNYRSENGSLAAFGALTGTGGFTGKGGVLRAISCGLRVLPCCGPSLQHILSPQGCHQASGNGVLLGNSGHAMYPGMWSLAPAVPLGLLRKWKSKDHAEALKQAQLSLSSQPP